jgi:hypothetical protein
MHSDHMHAHSTEFASELGEPLDSALAVYCGVA